MSNLGSLIGRYTSSSLIGRICLGIIAGILLAIFAPDAARSAGAIGTLFVKALQAVAPVLVFFLVISAIANQPKNSQTAIKPIISLYLAGTFFAAFTAVVLSFLFPVSLALVTEAAQTTPPEGIGEVIKTLIFQVVQNPVNALLTGNFVGILAWAIALGVAMRHAEDSSRIMAKDLANAVSSVVRLVIQLAPFGIFGLVAQTIATTGFSALSGYAHLLAVLLGAMAIIALVVNPLIVYLKISSNPYPLVFRCLRESGITAFFTRSSAANIPVNMKLCEDLKLHKDTYSVSIPLGATINMAGAAITITVMTLAAVHTLGIHIDLATALLLSLVATISACGASGVAGGSLLLIPLACSLFGIPNEVAMQVVGVGFIIGVIQDSAETGLNSSTDVMFTAAVCIAEEKRDNKATVNV